MGRAWGAHGLPLPGPLVQAVELLRVTFLSQSHTLAPRSVMDTKLPHNDFNMVIWKGLAVLTAWTHVRVGRPCHTSSTSFICLHSASTVMIDPLCARESPPSAMCPLPEVKHFSRWQTTWSSWSEEGGSAWNTYQSTASGLGSECVGASEQKMAVWGPAEMGSQGGSRTVTGTRTHAPPINLQCP